MRRRFLLLGLSFALLGASQAEEGRGPRIRVDPTTFDFGKVRPGHTLRKEFRLRNLGDERLVIERVSHSCTCTGAEIDEMSLEPGAATPLRVGLRTPRDPGPVKGSVLIRSNDQKTPLFEIQLVATVVEE